MAILPNQNVQIEELLTLATLRGIGVTLNPKGGGQNLPFKKHRLYELAQMFSMVDLFFSI